MNIERFNPAQFRPGQIRTLATVVSMTLIASVIAGCGGGGGGDTPTASAAAGNGTSSGTTASTSGSSSGTSSNNSAMCTTALASSQAATASTTTSSSTTSSTTTDGNSTATPSLVSLSAFEAPVDHLIVKLASASASTSSNGARTLAAASTAADPARVGNVISRVLTQWNTQRSKASILAATSTGGSTAALPSFDNVQLERTMSDGSAVVSLGKRVSSTDANTLAQAFAADSDVAYAEPDRRLFASAATVTPNDPSYAQQWNDFSTATGTNMPAAWSLTTGASTVVTAVLDTGYRPHTDIAANLVAGYDFITDVNTGNNGHGRSADATDPGDWVTQAELNDSTSPFYNCASAPSNSSWHGTQVAGLIGAVGNNGTGIAGASWFGKIQPVRVLGKCGGTTSDIADAMRWAAGISVSGVADNPTPAKVINLSLGGSGPCGSTFQSAINDVIARGVTVVVAAGNDGLANGQDRPANCTGVIAVGATDSTGKRAWYSNYSPEITVSAPGSTILSTSNTGTTSPGSDTYQTNSGTSLAAPQVAGVASLMLALNPNLTPAQISQKLIATARPSQIAVTSSSACTAMAPGAGLMDAGAAVASATN
ncbi:S8 family peptidase [Burkholderia sp. 22PA0099]|uniref:S8 family peptidase n=1 Tax=Burkholderia sp. 22PA0099 TaxID=3237372 RepID=UPI0039C0B38C